MDWTPRPASVLPGDPLVVKVMTTALGNHTNALKKALETLAFSLSPAGSFKLPCAEGSAEARHIAVAWDQLREQHSYSATFATFRWEFHQKEGAQPHRLAA